eukprot:4132115-Amphidinium_carterae.1
MYMSWAADVARARTPRAFKEHTRPTRSRAPNLGSTCIERTALRYATRVSPQRSRKEQKMDMATPDSRISEKFPQEEDTLVAMSALLHTHLYGLPGQWFQEFRTWQPQQHQGFDEV